MVVSDTTPITTLLKARHVDLLQKLFGSVTIPKAVLEELRAFHSAAANLGIKCAGLWARSYKRRRRTKNDG